MSFPFSLTIPAITCHIYIFAQNFEFVTNLIQILNIVTDIVQTFFLTNSIENDILRLLKKNFKIFLQVLLKPFQVLFILQFFRIFFIALL